MIVFQNNTGSIQITKRNGNFTMKEQHMHPNYELHYLLSGEQIYLIGEQMYRVNQGSFIFIEKSEPHRTIDAGGANHERLICNFTSSLFEGLPIQGRSGVVNLPPSEHLIGEVLVRELITEWERETIGRDYMLDLLLGHLLLLVFRAQEKQNVREDQLTSVDRIMPKIIDYIKAHYRETLLLRDVAKIYFVSPYYLSRRFKICTGLGFTEYVQQVRIREAQRLLLETNLRMNEVAERIGIGRIGNFYEAFKKTCGCSPLQYRKRQRVLLLDKGK